MTCECVCVWGGGGWRSNWLFPIETHMTCDFQGEGPDPLSPPLDPRNDTTARMFFYINFRLVPNEIVICVYLYKLNCIIYSYSLCWPGLYVQSNSYRAIRE